MTKRKIFMPANGRRDDPDDGAAADAPSAAPLQSGAVLPVHPFIIRVRLNAPEQRLPTDKLSTNGPEEKQVVDMRHENIHYETRSGLGIDFLLIDLGETLGWRAYILSDIDYWMVSKERSDSFTDTHVYVEVNRHRFIDPNKDYPYICWTKPIHSLETMHELVTMWAEITDYYIYHGGTFETIQEHLEESGVL